VVPYPLNSAFHQRRAALAYQLVNQLLSLNPYDVITSDESWFYFIYDGSGMWVRDRSELEQVESRIQDGKKAIMISIFWRFGDILFVHVLGEDATYNTRYVVDSTLLPCLEYVAECRRPSRGMKSFNLHCDNAKPHYSNDTQDEVRVLLFNSMLAHPPRTPDLAPSDFFLFGNLKSLVVGKTSKTKFNWWMK
jgi:histone-lysine N-methyltransferase SETMAR